MTHNPLEGRNPNERIEPGDHITREHVLERFKAYERTHGINQSSEDGRTLEEISASTEVKTREQKEFLTRKMRDLFGEGLMRIDERFSGKTDAQGQQIFEVIGTIREHGKDRLTNIVELAVEPS